MSVRSNGSYIGPRPDGPSTSTASGIWTLREVAFYKRANQWTLPFTPDQASGLQLWLDASDAGSLYDATTGGSLVAADGGVARWEDKSGNSRHATQSTAANRPSRKTAIQNGKDVLRFDGSSDVLSVSAFNLSTSAQCFFVSNATGDSSGQVRNGALINFTAAGSQSHFGGTNDDWYENFYASTRVLLGDMPMNQFVSGVVKTTSTEMVGKVFGQAEVSVAATFSGNPSKSSIGQGLGFSGGYYFNGDAAEIIIYSPALSDTDSAKVESYLNEKWGIA